MDGWDVLGSAASVAQLVGVDAAGLITKIRQAARTARQNRTDCELLAQRVDLLADLVPPLQQDQHPTARRAAARLGAALSDAHHLVMSCQARGRASHFFTGSGLADRFRDVNNRIESYLSIIPLITHIRLDHHVHSRSNSAPEEEQGREFTRREIATATDHLLSADAASGTKVYRGKLGQEMVAVKRREAARPGAEDAFFMEHHILARLRHDHIVRLLGHCADADSGDRALVTQTQYMPNGSLHDHLHGHRSSSPVAASWRTRVQVLLGAARAVHHLHCHAVPLVIHGNVASSNVLLDAAWAPRLCGFGSSVWQAAGVASQPVEKVTGAAADPEYRSTGRIRPATDVYCLGVVMLEALTGKPPVVSVWDDASQSVVTMTLASFALPSIEAGRLGDVLDGRPAPALAAWQALQLVASTAARCLRLHGDNRPAISEVVANLEHALRLI